MRATPAAALLVLCAMPCAGQQPRGRYHFVQLSVNRAGEAQTLSGTLAFDGAGRFRFEAKGAAGEGEVKAAPAAGTWAMTSPADAAATIEVRASMAGAAILAGAARQGAAHALLLAARAPEAGAGGAELLRGDYGGAWFGFGDGTARAMESALVAFSADGRGGLTAVSSFGHEARGDDLNRKAQAAQGKYAVEAGGAGAMTVDGLKAGFGGEHAVMVSADGEVVLGVSNGARRGVLAAVRKTADSGIFSVRGAYWLAEVAAEVPFAHQPERAVFSSAAGVAVADGSGGAQISQWVREGDAVTTLETVNAYRVEMGGAGMLAPRLNPALRNFFLGAGGTVLVGAQVGLPDQLTLEHGMFVAVRTSPAAEGGVAKHVVRVTHADGAAADDARPAASGEALVIDVAGVAAGKEARVLFGGVAATGAPEVTPGEGTGVRIRARVPAGLAGGRVPVAVATGGAVVDVAEIVVRGQ